MGMFDFLRGPDIQSGIEEYKAASGAVLLDVRTEQEYREGHIPDSVNLPLPRIGEAEDVIPELDTPVFVYCLSGARSRQAAALLEEQGYENVKNIGGISAYRGKVVR